MVAALKILLCLSIGLFSYAEVPPLLKAPDRQSGGQPEAQASQSENAPQNGNQGEIPEDFRKVLRLDMAPEEIKTEISKQLSINDIFKEKTFFDRISKFIEIYNKSPLLRRQPTPEELSALIADQDLRAAAANLLEILKKGPTEGMNEDQILQYINEIEPYRQAAYQLARQMLRESVAVPLVKDLFRFKFVTEFNLDSIGLASRWFNDWESREPLVFLFTSISDYYFNDAFFESLKIQRQWSYNAWAGGKWGIALAVVGMAANLGVTKAKDLTAWARTKLKSHEPVPTNGRVKPGRKSTAHGGDDTIPDQDPIFAEMERHIQAIGRVFPKTFSMNAPSKLQPKFFSRLNRRVVVSLSKSAVSQSIRSLGLILGVGVAVAATNVVLQKLIRVLDPTADMNDTYLIPLDILGHNYLRLAALELQCMSLDFAQRMDQAKREHAARIATAQSTDPKAAENQSPFNIEHYDEFMALATMHGTLLLMKPALTKINDITEGGRYTIERDETGENLIVKFPLKITEQRDESEPVTYTIPESEQTETIHCPRAFNPATDAVGLDEAKENIWSAVN